MESRKNRLDELMTRFDVAPLSIEEILGISESTLNAWLRGARNPQKITQCIKLAKLFNTNISYLLGFTDINIPLDTYELNIRLKGIIKEKKVTKYKITQETNVSRLTLDALEGNYEKARLLALVKISELLNVSIDYLLGLTHYENWEDYYREKDPFYDIEKGSAMLIAKEGSDAKIAALLSNDGNYIYLANGEKVDKDNHLFRDCRIIKMVPEEV